MLTQTFGTTPDTCNKMQQETPRNEELGVIVAVWYENDWVLIEHFVRARRSLFPSFECETF